MISEIYILFFKASLTIRHTATVSQKKSGTSKKIQWDFQISRVGSLDFLDLKVNGSPVYGMRKLVGLQLFLSGTPTFSSGTPTFCQMGVLYSCFQNPSESSDLLSGRSKLLFDE